MIIFFSAVPVVGFERTLYRVSENDSLVMEICAILMPPPSLAEGVNFTVTITFVDGTAQGGYNGYKRNLNRGRSRNNIFKRGPVGFSSKKGGVQPLTREQFVLQITKSSQKQQVWTPWTPPPPPPPLDLPLGLGLCEGEGVIMYPLYCT